MVTWSEFARLAPDLAGRGQRLFAEHGVVFLATVRKDGSPRLHPVVPILSGMGLFVAVSRKSPKRYDLLHDGRFALHAVLGESDEEFVATGRVKLVDGEDERSAVAGAAGHTVHHSDAVFEFLLVDAFWGYWERPGTPNTYPVRQTWSSPTSH